MLIYILEPLPLLSDMFAMLIHRVQPQTRIYTANSFWQFYALINKCEVPDFLIIDPDCMDFLGVIALKHVSERLPNSKIILTANSDMDFNFEFFDADGDKKFYYLNKKDTARNISFYLTKFIKKNQLNNSDFDNQKIYKLSKRHRQLINFLAEGYSNEKMAVELNISAYTVKTHLNRLYKLLGTKSRLQTLSLARTEGFIVDNY